MPCEPKGVNWINFGQSTLAQRLFRLAQGFGLILLALCFWTLVFYVPYAWSVLSFNYDNGAELPAYYSIIFTVIVVGGNAAMYFVCDACCDIIAFRFKDQKQVCYTMMYLAACMINVVLDLAVTYKISWKVMTGQGFRTYNGVPLREIEVFTEQFETYAMQRSLGENAYAYAW